MVSVHMDEFRLQPARAAPEFADELLAGPWAAVLPEMLSIAQVEPWCAYTVLSAGRIVGLGSFKGAPDDSGRVEIAYLTFWPDEGRGIARKVAAQLVDKAREHGASSVFAHTLPEESASTAVLRANAFAHAGQVDDPEDGPVWRWVRSL